MRKKRQGLIVWYQHRRNINKIKRYGHLLYTSKKQKYAVVYVNQNRINTVENQLVKLPFVKKVLRSQKPFIRTNFEKREPVNIKDYDYHLGI